MGADGLNDWRVERAGPTPPYAQIEARLAALIESGQLAPGERVPSERELAARVGVSRATARAALAGLAQRGLVERGSGRRGSVVSRPRLQYDLRDFAGFTEMARRQGLAAQARTLLAQTLAATPAVAEALGICPGAAVHHIGRLRSAGGEPMALEQTWLPAALYPGLLDHDLSGSLYTVMDRDYGRAPVSATERLEACNATAEQAGALGVAPGAALMLVVRVARAQDGTPVEFARDHHRGDRARFVAALATRPPTQKR
jgi:GntR family transcriptional regulator